MFREAARSSRFTGRALVNCAATGPSRGRCNCVVSGRRRWPEAMSAFEHRPGNSAQARMTCGRRGMSDDRAPIDAATRQLEPNADATVEPTGPILLLAACPRCGTNYLEALLLLHPHCRQSRVPEDFFLANSATLLRFCRSLVESWEEPRGGVAQVAAYLGAGLLRFAGAGEAVQGRQRLLLRSPTSEGITAVTALFPEARIVALVRDGPATVESGRRSFGW